MSYFIVALILAITGLVVLKWTSRRELDPTDTALVVLMALLWPFTIIVGAVMLFFCGLTWLINKI